LSMGFWFHTDYEPLPAPIGYDSQKFHDQVGKVLYELCGGLQALQRCSVEELMKI